MSGLRALMNSRPRHEQFFRGPTPQGRGLMYGLIRARRSGLGATERAAMKAYHCGLCHGLCRNYGWPYSSLTGRDGRFLALMVDAQMVEDPPLDTIRCPGLGGLSGKSIMGHDIATRYAAAVSVYLLGQRLEDAFLDDASQLALWATSLTAQKVRRSSEVLAELRFPLQQALELKSRQIALESLSKPMDIAEALGPSGSVTALLLSHTAELANTAGNAAVLAQLGACLGRLLTLMDACFDFGQDQRRHRYNVVAASGCGASSSGALSTRCFREVENLTSGLLEEARLLSSRLVLSRHKSIIENILCLGLQDVAMRSLRSLVRNFSAPLTSQPAVRSKPNVTSALSDSRVHLTSGGVIHE